MNPIKERAAVLTRRQLLSHAGLGLGAAALGALESRRASAAELKSPNQLGLPHFAAKAKRVIYLFHNGGPSHVDLYDYKPKLRELDGKEIPPELVAGKRFSTMTQGSKKAFMPEITKFAQKGESGRWIAEDFLPNVSQIVDELCFIQSMQTTQVNHYELPAEKTAVKLVDPENMEELVRLLHEEARVI